MLYIFVGPAPPATWTDPLSYGESQSPPRVHRRVLTFGEVLFSEGRSDLVWRWRWRPQCNCRQQQPSPASPKLRLLALATAEAGAARPCSRPAPTGKKLQHSPRRIPALLCRMSNNHVVEMVGRMNSRFYLLFFCIFLHNSFGDCCLKQGLMTVTGDGRVREWRIGIQWGLP